ncbi:metal ABC transporter permease [Acidithiobacillus sp. AMEEHan]|uniref:metal ABC transporter permease n=1 Tax=Acidithiobacillus sp. AMEEHan TaxID=2994951 RepID=UPI0027E4873B|nr:metal ABC transporter permease [Acidithiobacillus sp. AMEEHan]
MFSSFLLHTWIAATLLAIAAGSLGYFVVLRRSAFAAHALPLAAFPGGALASLFGFAPLWGLGSFAIIGVLFLRIFSRLGRRDVAMGLLLSSFLALGGLFLSLGREYAARVYGLLFGEVLGISAASLLPLGLLVSVVLLLLLWQFPTLLLESTQAELANARAISSAHMEWFFLLLLALVSAAAVPVVGTLLVFTLLVSPAAAAQRLSRRPYLAWGLAILFAELLSWSSIALSYWSNWPLSFFVGVQGAALFLFSRIFARS